MLSLKSRKDYFKLLLPRDFICPEIEEKYTKILSSKQSFYYTPIDFLNETIQKVQVFGFADATWVQPQQTREGTLYQSRYADISTYANDDNVSYRSQKTPISLMDKTLNIEFRHTLGYLNYFMLFENFWWQFSRNKHNNDPGLNYDFNIDIFNEIGEIYSRVVIKQPLVNSMDMLDFDFAQPIAQSGTFKVEFKYNNFDYQFIDINDNDNEN